MSRLLRGLTLALALSCPSRPALGTNDPFPICTDPAEQHEVDIDGNIVVWEDDRNYETTGWDIYGYDLATGQEFPVSTAEADQRKPAVSGSIVVWEDYRHNGYARIYGRELPSGPEFPISYGGFWETTEAKEPDVSGDTVVWAHPAVFPIYGDEEYDEIRGYSISSDSEFHVCSRPEMSAPAISGNLVVWSWLGRETFYASYVDGLYLPDGDVFRMSFVLGYRQFHPDVSGEVVAWEREWETGNIVEAVALAGEPVAMGGWVSGYRPAVSGRLMAYCSSGICLADLLSGSRAHLADAWWNEEGPAISGNVVVWSHDGDIFGIVVDGPGHGLTVTASGPDPYRIPSGGTTSVSAVAEDTFGHALTWQWRDKYVNDHDVGGEFLPDATASSPTYIAPWNLIGSDAQIALEVSVSCDGTPQLQAGDAVTVLVTWDYDDDTMPDYWEHLFGLDLLDPSDAEDDPDTDGMPNWREYVYGCDPWDPDTDGDGFADGLEWELFTDPSDPLDFPEYSPDFVGDPTSGTVPLMVQFTDLSPSAASSWLWGFGDGATSTQQNPAHEYTKPGHYTVSLTITPVGVSDSEVKADYIVVTFTDVAVDFWACDEILTCVEAGVVSGYPDGSYQPTLAVTRDQMAVYMARALTAGDENVPEFTDTPTFPDVGPENWALEYVEYALEQNVVEGYGDGLYHPEYEVTRDQMAVYVARALVAPTGEAALTDYVPADPRNFPDVASDFWSYRHIEYCVEHGVVAGYLDGYYHPEIVVTRDQMAVYVARAFGLLM